MIDILRLIFLEKLVIVCVFLFSSIFQSTFASSDVLDDKPSFVATPLSSISSTTDLEPGTYISDDIEQILSFALSSFGEEDMAIFDMDQTLITQLRPYYHAHQERNSPLHKRLMCQSRSVKDKFDAYTFSFSPFALMDEKIPEFIRQLQRQKVKCIANTAMWPVLPSAESVNVTSLRIKSLQVLGIDFSSAFTYFPFWDFSTLEKGHIVRYPPVFRDGVILSADVPKEVTTLELLKNLSFTPKRVVFIDDTAEHAEKMYKALTAEGIETYSFIYSKAHNTISLDYFSVEQAATHLAEIEGFLERLLSGEDIDEIFKSL